MIRYIFNFLTSLPPCEFHLKFDLFLCTDSGYKQMISSCRYSSSTLYITHSWSRLCFAYSCISSVPFSQKLRYFVFGSLWTPFFKFQSWIYSTARWPRLEMRLINGTLPTQPTFQSNITLINLISRQHIYIYIYIPLNQRNIAPISHSWSTPEALGQWKKYYVEIFRINKTIIHLKYFALSDWL